jgi:hypothetical protein
VGSPHGPMVGWVDDLPRCLSGLVGGLTAGWTGGQTRKRASKPAGEHDCWTANYGVFRRRAVSSLWLCPLSGYTMCVCVCAPHTPS